MSPRAPTMVVSVPVMAQDMSLLDEPELGRWLSLAGWYVMTDEEPYYDGPVSRRVAVVDLDPSAGRLRPPARFLDGRPSGRTSRYDVEPGESDEWGLGEIAAVETDAFLQASVFGTVLKTLRFVESAEMLGRPVPWAFGGDQLLVVPRAGEMANAFYDRSTRSLQFFSVLPADGGPAVHTALSHDVVVHETAHALLDGLCPDLYDAITPQARAVHESFADLISLLVSLTDRYRLSMELDLHKRSLRSRTTFARLAEQLGRYVGESAEADALRDANNRHTLDPRDTRVDRHGRPYYIDSIAPHELSLVLTGALYGVFRRLADEGKKRYSAGIPKSHASLDLGPTALGAYLAAQRVAQMIVQALDYLPPGDASFADFGRAVLLADELARPRNRQSREWLARELLARRIVASGRELALADGSPEAPPAGFEAGPVLHDDEAALRFADKQRAYLGLPAEAELSVHPRRLVGGAPSPGAADRRKLVLRLSWWSTEDNQATRQIAPQRAFATGLTAVLDWSSGRLLRRLTSDTAVDARHAVGRERMIRWLADEEMLLPAELALGPDGGRLRAPIVARAVGRTMRLTGGARMVHCATLACPSS